MAQRRNYPREATFEVDIAQRSVMDNLQLTRLPSAKTGMLIRKQVQWDWESRDVSSQATPKAI